MKKIYKKLFYEEYLPMRNRIHIDWENSIGKEVKFIYDDIEGFIKILKYDKENLIVTYQYKDIIFSQKTVLLKKCNLRDMLFLVFRYEIDEIIESEDHKRKIKIINKYHLDSRKIYEYECLICGFHGERLENQINYLWCPCCSNKIVVQGVNDIPTTDPWMIPYFQGGEEEAKLYMHGSNHKIYPICPDCGKIKRKSISISQIYENHSIGCSCSDKKSYPNKFIISVLDQLNVDYDYEVVFNWAKQYRYDAVIYLLDRSDNLNIIIEMDGGLGHGKGVYGIKDKEEKILKQRKDILKDMDKEIKALENNNKLIRIDCEQSNKEYIKNNILNSELSKYYDLSNIDWDECDRYANKNIIKTIADYVLTHNNVNYNELSEVFSINKSRVGKYLKRANKCGFISDSLYNDLIYRSKIRTKELYVFDKNKNFIKKYCSVESFCNNCYKDFGITASSGGVSKAVKNKSFFKRTLFLSYDKNYNL